MPEKYGGGVEGFAKLIKYLMFIFNLIIFFVGCVVLGIGIWIAVDRNYMSAIVGTYLFSVAAYFLIVAGAIILIISFFGSLGALKENKCMLITFFAFLLIIFLVLLIAGIMAAVFRSEIEDKMRATMQNTLRQNYGVDSQHEFNRAVTEGWDRVQEKLYCCSVDQSGWALYRESQWYKRQSEIAGLEKKLVPQSCCIKEYSTQEYKNLQICQESRIMPPGVPSGARNDYLHYDGCYNSGKKFLYEHSSILMGVGIGIAILMILGMVCSIILYRNIRD